MPLRPPPDELHSDPRLDPYRQRAGILFSDDEQVGTVYLRADTYWQQVGGHLWWRRWSAPMDCVHGFLRTVDGGFDDFFVGAECLADELVDWDHGRFAYLGETLRVHWLDDAATRRVAAEVFGLDGNA